MLGSFRKTAKLINLDFNITPVTTHCETWLGLYVNASYSGTSLNGQLPIVATSLMQPLDPVPIEALLIKYSQVWTLFCKVDRFFGPSSTWTVQNSLDSVRTNY